MVVTLTPQMESMIEDRLATGHYRDAGEVLHVTFDPASDDCGVGQHDMLYRTGEQEITVIGLIHVRRNIERGTE